MQYSSAVPDNRSGPVTLINAAKVEHTFSLIRSLESSRRFTMTGYNAVNSCSWRLAEGSASNIPSRQL